MAVKLARLAVEARSVAALVSTMMFTIALLEARTVALHEVVLHHEEAGGE